MTGLAIQNLPESVVAYHRRRAETAGVKVEDLLRERLIGEARAGREALFETIAAFHAAMEARYGKTGTIVGVVADVREVRVDREERSATLRGR